jgi:tetratricopeptide (TPR) repeat protein
MLELPEVTLCCVDTLHHALALRALRCSTADIRFGRTLFISDCALDEPGIDVRLIEPLDSREAYSQFVLKSLLQHVDTPHVLLIQWDGYAINPGAWRDDFLHSDYIGAKWFWYEDGMRVGNGGFSLRSRKLLAALQDPRIKLVGPEDETIGRVFRPLLEREHGIRFAPEALADVFAFEAAYPIGKPFGFHGLFNFCRVTTPEELTGLVAHFTPDIARSTQLAQLARNCLAMGQWSAAAAIFARILEENPGDAPAAIGLATANSHAAALPPAGRNDPCPCGSGKRYKHCHGAAAATVAAPGASTPSVEQRLATALSAHHRGDTTAAQTIYRDVLETSLDHPLALHYLGVIAYQRGDAQAAVPLLERSARAVSAEPEFQNNLGLAYAACDRESDAIAAYRAALRIKPDHAVAWNNLGLALQSINDLAGAISAFRRAVELRPDFAHAHWNLSLALLLDGRFDEGWREYDWRLSLPELGQGRHNYSGPVWDGKEASGKTLLLYAEQGLGDAVQFARFATLAARSAARVVIHAPDALCTLLASVSGVSATVSSAVPTPSYDAHLALMSLPRVFDTNLNSIPADMPYINVPQPQRREARERLAPYADRLKVGVAWAGSRAHANDRNRSCPLATLAMLFDIPGVAWFSLQHGEAAAQIAAMSKAANIAPLAADSALVDTAALIAELDLIVSVDTSVVHLAGALARPCWVLLPFAPDWRWLLHRDDTPWYPTLRLFRQPTPRDWASVVIRVASELRALSQH